jgi:hypothetical protein
MGTLAAGRFCPLAGELLLAAWEDGGRCHELYRPLALLAAALPEADPADLATLPVAERDLLLLRLREMTFGAELEVFGRCEACGEPLEFTLRADEIAAELAAATAAAGDTTVEWAEAGRWYRIRPVTTEDLAATLAVPDVGAAGELLLARCVEVEGAASEGDSLSPDEAPAPASPFPASVARRFAELHAAAEVRCAIDCPACGAGQVLDLDIGRFLWREIAVAARRMLADVHLLALAYGWAERDIIALSSARRAAYLELAGAR